MRAVACLLMLAFSACVRPPLQAQFTSLIAPGDGQEVYFAQDLPLKGSGEPPYQGRIFKIGTTPLTTVADVPKTGEIYCGNLVYCTSSAYDLSEPDVNRDGTVVIYTGYYRCSNGVRCPYPYSTYMVGNPVGGCYGKGRLSGNGRYLVCYSENTGEYPFSALTVTDLETGTISKLPYINSLGGRFAPDGRVAADDGSFVIVYGQVEVYRHGQFVSRGADSRGLERPGLGWESGPARRNNPLLHDWPWSGQSSGQGRRSRSHQPTFTSDDARSM